MMNYEYLKEDYRLRLRFNHEVEGLRELKHTFDDLEHIQRQFIQTQLSIYKGDYPKYIAIKVVSVTKKSPIEVALNIDLELLAFLYFLWNEYGNDWRTVKKLSRDISRLEEFVRGSFTIMGDQLHDDWHRIEERVLQLINWFNSQTIEVRYKFLRFLNKIRRTFSALHEIWIEKR
ncbi:hypothetical protein JYU20_03690 [Bacteroidales bacterium AH-315-I05]|nr:hypothetical protein [Bacteroidales bacterium AH-315-I05]